MDFKDELEQFIGTEDYYQLSLFPVYGTDGVKYFCEKAQAYWLFEEMAMIAIQNPKERFIVCEANSKDNKCTIKFHDGNYIYFFEKTIPYTDLPEGKWEFLISNYPESRVIMLPSEY